MTLRAYKRLFQETFFLSSEMEKWIVAYIKDLPREGKKILFDKSKFFDDFGEMFDIWDWKRQKVAEQFAKHVIGVLLHENLERIHSKISRRKRRYLLK